MNGNDDLLRNNFSKSIFLPQLPVIPEYTEGQPRKRGGSIVSLRSPRNTKNKQNDSENEIPTPLGLSPIKHNYDPFLINKGFDSIEIAHNSIKLECLEEEKSNSLKMEVSDI